MNNMCEHKDKNGNSSIFFFKNRWNGVYPKKIKGICTICKKELEVTEEEYKKFIKEGDEF